jgi:hypothetical protein
MATATVEHQPVTQKPQLAPVTKVSPIVPIKVGFFGGQGSGKTTSAALLAAALSKEQYGGAPIFVLDTEPGWQFLKRRVFDVEGIEMHQRTEPTFKAMIASIREAEKLGCCVWAVDSLTIIWQELMQSFQQKNHGEIPINVWGDIKQMWADYTTAFLNSKMNCFALGRLGNEMSEIEDEKKPGRTKLVKTGTKFKAGGGESFGYEPHLLLELSLEKKARRKAGVEHEGEGRMIHRVDVLKDRTWALNGKVLRWSDKAGYVKGGYNGVWQSIQPHFNEVQMTMGHVQIATGASSQSLISDDGNSEYYQRKQRRDTLVGELSAVLEILWGGQTKDEKRLRKLAGEALFGVLTPEAWGQMSLEKIERGAKIMQSFRKRCEREGLPDTELATLAALQIDINAFDEGTAEENDLPF